VGTPLIDDDAYSFDAISCPTTTTCVIVGVFSYDSSSGLEAAGVWLDKSGKLTQIPVPTIGMNVVKILYGVTCPTAQACEAAGLGTDGGEIASIVLTPKPAVSITTDDTLADLTGASCPVTGYCAFVGSGGNAGALLQVVDRKTATSELGPVYGFSSVACLAAGECEVAGQAEGASFSFTGYVGAVVHSHLQAPLVEVPGATVLFSVATLGTADYLVVGTDEGGQRAQLVSSTGALLSYGIVGGGYLQGVACPGTTQCVAVGFTAPHGTRISTVEFLTIKGLRSAPSAPTVRVLSVSASSETVRLGPPAIPGTDPVTHYRLRVQVCERHHAGCHLRTVTTLTVGAGHRTVTVGHLEASTPYYLSATATSAAGTSPYSATVRRATAA
jgi:hypothetical protein